MSEVIIKQSNYLFTFDTQLKTALIPLRETGLARSCYAHCASLQKPAKTIVLRESSNNIFETSFNVPANKFRLFKLRGATPADTHFATPLQIPFSEKFQLVTA